jgi:hypothetical protein
VIAPGPEYWDPGAGTRMRLGRLEEKIEGGEQGAWTLLVLASSFVQCVGED